MSKIGGWLKPVNYQGKTGGNHFLLAGLLMLSGRSDDHKNPTLGLKLVNQHSTGLPSTAFEGVFEAVIGTMQNVLNDNDLNLLEQNEVLEEIAGYACGIFRFNLKYLLRIVKHENLLSRPKVTFVKTAAKSNLGSESLEMILLAAIASHIHPLVSEALEHISEIPNSPELINALVAVVKDTELVDSVRNKAALALAELDYEGYDLHLENAKAALQEVLGQVKEANKALIILNS